MILLAFSAATIGAIHSLEPAHWLPIVMIAKSRVWTRKRALAGAFVSAMGNMVVALILGGIANFLGTVVLKRWEPEIEKYSALGLMAFGAIYAFYSWKHHISCHDHEHGHHGPQLGRGRNAFVFFFFLGASPCVAMFPLISVAIPYGAPAILSTLLAFSAGTGVATILATDLALRGVKKLDWPFLEHHGETLTGIGVFVLGLILFLREVLA